MAMDAMVGSHPGTSAGIGLIPLNLFAATISLGARNHGVFFTCWLRTASFLNDALAIGAGVSNDASGIVDVRKDPV